MNKILNERGDASVPPLNPDGTTFQPAFINMYDVAQLLTKHAEQRIKVAKQRNKDNGKERKTN